MTAPMPLQMAISDSIMQAIADGIAYLPTVVGALVILIVGYILGRIVGGTVTRVVRRLGIDRFTEGTALGEGGDAIPRILGKLVKYYIYFVALLAAANVLNITELSDLLAELGAYLPVILGALVVLIVGFIAGRVIGDIVTGIVGDFGIEALLAETPLERLADEAGEFGRLVGKLVTYYVYLLTLLAVADILAVSALSEFLNVLAGYVPALVGGLVVLLVGIWVAERVGRLVSESDESRLASLAGLAVRVLIYYITVTIALSAIGFDTTVLTNLFTAFVVAFFGTLALALAIGVGVAVGLGGQDYVSENVEQWMAKLKGSVSEETE